MAEVMAVLSITDLDAIVKELKLFSKDKWDTFGLKAGLYQPTLSAIEANHNKDVDKCFRECVSCWLQKQDKVEEKGVPTWRRLADILEEVGDKALAENIRKRAGIDDSSSEAMTTVLVKDYDLEEEYLAMDRTFMKLLKRAIKKIFATNSLTDVKVFLTGINRSMIKAIKETNDEVQLMALLRNCFSLSNISTLKEFFEDCEIEHDAQELDKLLKDRDAFYKKILAKDFALKAIEISKKCSTDSTITFVVSWKVDEATLMDFELFLDKAFRSHKRYIHLKVIKQSLLTFVCTIPDWLVEELSDYVKEKKDFIISQGIVAVTIDNAIIFNVEGDYAALIFYEPNDIMTFTVVPSNKLTALLKFIKEQHQFAEVDLIHYFCFESLHGFVELRFTEKPPTGWKIMPNIKPCRLYQDDIDNFNGDYAPPFCQISVYGLPSPSTEPYLHSPVSLRGIKSAAILYIHRVITSTIPLSSSASYTGIIYYERKEDKHLMTFVAATKLTFLVKYIEDYHPLAMIKQLVNFDICSPDGHIKLILDALTEDKQSKEWTAKPQTFKLHQDDIDKFDGELDDSMPPLCVIPVFGPDDKSMLHYSLSLEGVVEPIKQFFDLKLSSSSDELYTGLVYYEWKVSEYLMTFIAGRNLSSLIQYIEEYHPMAEVDQIISFTFNSHHYIELTFDSLQNDSLNNGWTIQPLVKPCRLYQSEIDRFNEPNYPLPPSCLVSVYGSPNAVSSLHYSIPLVGVANPVTLFVHRKLRLERHVTELHSELHLLQGANDKLKKEEYEKEERIAASKKKLYEVSEKLSIMAKEKQELIKRVATLEKQQEQPKLFAYDVSKLEVVLQPMDNQWYQLGHHLNVEVSLLREIEQKKDAKEQMRSLLQLCSDRGVTMMQLEEALVALDQKSLIPGLKEFLSFSTSELLETETPDEEGRLTQKKNLAQEELKAELQEVKAALEVCQFEKEELQSAKEKLESDITLKDSTIAILVNEKSQLMKMMQSEEALQDLRVDEELRPWALSTEPSVVKRLQKFEIQRQELLKEFIHTERTHLKKLVIMKHIYKNPLYQFNLLSLQQTEALFPSLDRLVELHSAFCTELRERQAQYSDGVIHKIADVLLARFDGKPGELLRDACAIFASNETKAEKLIKEYAARIPEFKEFIQYSEAHPYCNRRNIKELLPCVWTRLVRYQLLLEQIQKLNKKYFDKMKTEDKEESERLGLALNCVRNILQYVNKVVKQMENRQKLQEYQSKLDSSPMEKSTHQIAEKYKDLNLTSEGRVLLHEGVLTWKISHRKTVEVKALLFSDILVLLNNPEDSDKLILKQYHIEPIRVGEVREEISPVIRVKEMILRHYATDKGGRSFLVVNNSPLMKRPQMYEFTAESAQEKKKWEDSIENAMNGKFDMMIPELLSPTIEESPFTQ